MDKLTFHPAKGAPFSLPVSGEDDSPVVACPACGAHVYATTVTLAKPDTTFVDGVYVNRPYRARCPQCPGEETPLWLRDCIERNVGGAYRADTVAPTQSATEWQHSR